MHAIRADFPTDWPHANIYTLSDLHLGDPQALNSVIKPACTDTPVIHLEAEHKRMSATM